MRKTIHQSFSVQYEYPVIFTHGVFRPENDALIGAINRLGENRLHRVALFIDSALGHEVERAAKYFDAHREQVELVAPPRIVPGGEAIKNDARHAAEITDLLAEKKMDRQSIVVALGGGAVLDAVGYAAALLHRGLRMIRLPTTVLAQNDAGVGVKNAINLRGVKNLIGTFAPPFAVINDLDFLRTLPDRAWTDGVAEAFKVSIIKDARFFEELCEAAASLRARDERAMENLVVRCAELHLEHIRGSGDPFEFGRARPLDFGHWSAHRLEQMSGFAVSHGHAVAIGIALDSCYAMLKGWLTSGEYNAIYEGLSRSGFTLWHEKLDDHAGLIAGLDEFREHLGGELCVTMPIGIGRKFEVNEIDVGLVIESISRLKHAHSAKTRTAPDVLPERSSRRTLG